MIINKISEDTAIGDMPQIIIDYFNNLDEIPNSNFIVAGYSNIEATQEQIIYKVRLKKKEIEKIDASSQGATWDGETLTLTRLLQNVALKGHDGKYADLPFESVLWEYFTLQDAVDFARFAVETTINTMRFKNVVETVGGGIDILVITPTEIQWLQKENLH